MSCYSGVRTENMSPDTIDYSAYGESFGHIMEGVISIRETDSKLFDSIIECDILEASGIIQEGAMDVVKNIGYKAMQAIDKAIQYVKDAVAKFISNVKKFVHREKKMVEKYGKALKMENMKGFGGISGKFAFPRNVITSEDLQTLDQMQSKIDEFVSSVREVSGKDQISNAYEKVKVAFTREYKGGPNDNGDLTTSLMRTKFESPVENWKPTSDSQLSQALKMASSGTDYINSIKAAGNKVIAGLKKGRDTVKATMNTMKNGKATEEESYRMKTIYDVYSNAIKSYHKQLGAYINVCTKQITAYRKVVTVCGAYAIKRSGGKSTDNDTEEKKAQQEAMLYIVGESSDMYVTEVFGY